MPHGIIVENSDFCIGSKSNGMKSTLLLSFLLLFSIFVSGQNTSTEQKLAEYKALYDKGLIEDDEYKKLKNELLFGGNSNTSTNAATIDENGIKAAIGEQYFKDKVAKESEGSIALESFRKTNGIAHDASVYVLEFVATIRFVQTMYKPMGDFGVSWEHFGVRDYGKIAINSNDTKHMINDRIEFKGKLYMEKTDNGWRVKNGDWIRNRSIPANPTSSNNGNSSVTITTVGGAITDSSNSKRFSCYSSTVFDYEQIEVEVPTKTTDVEERKVYETILSKVVRSKGLRLSGFVDFNKEPTFKVKVESALVSYTSKTVQNQKYYTCKIVVSYVLLDSSGKEINRTSGEVESVFSDAITTKQQAFDQVLKYIYKAIDTPIYHFFPIKARLIQLYDKNRKDIGSRGVIDKGASVGVFDNCKFNVFHNGRKIGLLHIREFSDKESKGTFAGDGIDEINALFNKGEELYCISVY